MAREVAAIKWVVTSCVHDYGAERTSANEDDNCLGGTFSHFLCTLSFNSVLTGIFVIFYPELGPIHIVYNCA